VTATVALAGVLVPPVPVQVSVNVAAAVSGPVLATPLAAFAPVQPPEAVQAVAFVELHVRVDAAPLATEVGAAARVTVGTGAGAVVTATVAVAGVLVPPGPVQVKVYVAAAVNAPVLRLPLVACAPVQLPEAVQAVALVELHVSVDAAPLATEVGAAARVTVGTGELALTVTVAVSAALVPPAPAQVSE